MAFQDPAFIPLYTPVIKHTYVHTVDEIEKAVCENFILEERLTEEREKIYFPFVNGVANYNEWMSKDYDYCLKKLSQNDIGQVITYTACNNNNCIQPVLKSEDYLVRVIKLDRLINYKGGARATEVQKNIEAYFSNRTDKTLRSIVAGYLDLLNKGDKRPVWAAFLNQMTDIFEPAPKTNWPNILRNILGLGHIKNTTRVLLLRYKINRVSKSGDSFYFPTVLESYSNGGNGFFFPSEKLSGFGVSLNLGNDYVSNEFNEILHKPFDLEPEDLYLLGQIDTDYPVTLMNARKRHKAVYLTKFKHQKEVA
jgi:hypothetical protein